MNAQNKSQVIIANKCLQWYHPSPCKCYQKLTVVMNDHIPFTKTFVGIQWIPLFVDFLQTPFLGRTKYQQPTSQQK